MYYDDDDTLFFINFNSSNSLNGTARKSDSTAPLSFHSFLSIPTYYIFVRSYANLAATPPSAIDSVAKEI